MNKKTLWGVLALIVVVALVYWVSDQDSAQTPTAEAEEGTLEGTLTYPSQGIPDDMEVCAEDKDSTEKYCTDERISDPKYTTGIGYQLDVPAGTYNVYAYLQSDPSYRAYYNEFVTCGLSVDCESHKVIDVEVQSGETVSGIDPGDWYDQSQRSQGEEENTEEMTEAEVEARIVGTWRSDSDKNFVREFQADGTVVDVYEGETTLTSNGSWELFTSTDSVDSIDAELAADIVYLKMTVDGEALHFSVAELGTDSLTLIYLDRGGALVFSRVK